MTTAHSQHAGTGGAVTPLRRPVDQYSSITMETHRASNADVMVIVHGESDGLVRVLHGLCHAAVRDALLQSEHADTHGEASPRRAAR